MTTRPSNAAVREKRRGSTTIDLEQMNVLKALTAAEYSRRQFVLNFAASRDTQLLVPGRKADAIKEAEEWAVAELSKEGSGTVANDLFKYTVDARLWAVFVGDTVDFPFGFMRRGTGHSSRSSSVTHTDSTTMNDVSPTLYDTGVCRLDQVLTQESQPELPRARRTSAIEEEEAARKVNSAPSPRLPTARPASTQPDKPRMSKMRQIGHTTTEKQQRASIYDIEELKSSKKASEDKYPLLTRLGRSFSRRMSG
ncbi:hypothetical protein QBC39DRAFT_26289 [Podospora conica]|nr:hypothetical protein QBC39DRAFT_26289 [Schizothecium conicum]